MDRGDLGVSADAAFADAQRELQHCGCLQIMDRGGLGFLATGEYAGDHIVLLLGMCSHTMD